MDSNKAQHANGIFINLAATQRERIENGARLREEIRVALERGEAVSGYRVEWLDKTADRIEDLLADCAREFNEDHADDIISGQDLGDVLATVIHRLEVVGEEAEAEKVD